MSQKEWIEKDYYAVLGVDKSASAADIKKAYRKLAQKHHPDANAGDPKAEDKFKEVSAAYDVLSDEKTKEEYDRIRQMVAAGGFRSAGPGGAGFGGFGGGGQRVRVEDVGDMFGGASFGDLFGDLFGSGGGATSGFGGRAMRGADLETETSLSFEDALEGVQVELHIQERGGQPRTIKARIPAGVNDGARIKLAGKGSPGPGGGPAGDLYVKVKVRPHKIFGRKNKDLTLALPVTYAEAALGAQIDVPTMNGGPVKLKIPAGTSSGRTFRVRGKGVPSGRDKGDLLVTVQVAVPERLNREAKSLIEQLAALETESVRPALDELIERGMTSDG
ncbi:MAG TPA: DnaJ C-terminal domain-containing protein [Actinomycetota bacterium]|jgi:molecular chaperone DnaJ|nr:DnaJ C-terminal domain-containing protein [Actinomycetota bacterium]